jgi:hypothetical protein
VCVRVPWCSSPTVLHRIRHSCVDVFWGTHFSISVSSDFARLFGVSVGAVLSSNQMSSGVHIPNRPCSEVIVSERQLPHAPHDRRLIPPLRHITEVPCKSLCPAKTLIFVDYTYLGAGSPHVISPFFIFITTFTLNYPLDMHRNALNLRLYLLLR